MAHHQLTIRNLQSGGLITNYYCSSTCKHCLYRCSPAWPRHYITREDALNSMHIIQEHGCSSVHIGGGEPLLNVDGLLTVLKAAYQTGMGIDYVETNASWFRNNNHGYAVLARLRDAGLNTLLVSISPFHNEFIPFERTRNLIEACRDTGISVFPWVTDFVGDLQHFDASIPHSLDEYQSFFGDDYLATLPSRYWISAGGRALETFAGLGQQHNLQQLIRLNSGACRELTATSHFHVDLFGNYIPGLCTGLAIQQEDLGLPLSTEKYPLISILFSEGIRGLFSYATSEHSFIPGKASYSSKCELCYEIRSFLVMEKACDSPELQPAEHYKIGIHSINDGKSK